MFKTWRVIGVLNIALVPISSFGFRIYYARAVWSGRQRDLAAWFRDIFTSRLSVFVNKLSA
jgi:hypothetical protein